MALIPVDKVLDTIILFIEEQRPTYDTIIDRYHTGRFLNVFLGRRSNIPSSSLPSIEVAAVNESFDWFAVRVQEENPSIEIDITTDNGHPEQSERLQAALVSLTTRILAHPQHLRPRIQRSRTHMYDSFPQNVTYGTADQGRMKVATISWQGKSIEPLANHLFKICNQAFGPAPPPGAGFPGV